MYVQDRPHATTPTLEDDFWRRCDDFGGDCEPGSAPRYCASSAASSGGGGAAARRRPDLRSPETSDAGVNRGFAADRASLGRVRAANRTAPRAARWAWSWQRATPPAAGGASNLEAMFTM